MENTLEQARPSKENLLHACIARQRNLVADFNRGIQELQGNESAEYNEDQPGLAEEVAVRRQQLKEQLSFASKELEILEGMLTRCGELHDKVQLGSAVVTDSGLFYISVSIEQFEVEGVPVVGISRKSPLYQAMASKKRGDSFAFGADTYRIEEIY